MLNTLPFPIFKLNLDTYKICFQNKEYDKFLLVNNISTNEEVLHILLRKTNLLRLLNKDP